MKASSRSGTLANLGGFEATRARSDPAASRLRHARIATRSRSRPPARRSATDDPSHERGDLAGAFALLAKMSQDFALSMDIETTLERALALIAAQLDAEAGSLWLAESDGREIACHACVGPHPITGLRLPIGEGIVGRSVRENLCQCVLDVAKDPHFSQHDGRAVGLRDALDPVRAHAARRAGDRRDRADQPPRRRRPLRRERRAPAPGAGGLRGARDRERAHGGDRWSSTSACAASSSWPRGSSARCCLRRAPSPFRCAA